MVGFRGRGQRRQHTDPLRQVRGVTIDLAQRLAEVSEHLGDFMAALEQVADSARVAEESARRAGGDE